VFTEEKSVNFLICTRIKGLIAALAAIQVVARIAQNGSPVKSYVATRVSCILRVRVYLPCFNKGFKPREEFRELR